MFEAAELGRKIDKQTYKAQLPDLRAELLQTQFALSRTNAPVIIIISGMDAAGRGDVVNALNEWLDTRGLQTISLELLTDEEKERPYYWRFWRHLPERGRIAIFFGGWYVDPILQSVYDELSEHQLEHALNQIQHFERMLIDDGALILKFWLHLSKDGQKHRLKELENDPHTKRSVSKKDWQHYKKYPLFAKAAERVIRYTDAGYAPWILVEATDKYYRNLTVGRTLLHALQKRLAQTTPTLTENKIDIIPSLPIEKSADVTVLDKIDLSQHLENKEYRKQLSTYQGKLHRLAWEAYRQKRSTIIVFEGWDAAGKGGAIRRITQAMDARLYRVISTAAPTDEERAHHYLWRFWRHISRAGTFTIYDRSWYGRVLVERIEGFASEQEWQRSYSEINDFEAQLVEHHNIVIKFWLHIDQDEQLKRFKDREQIPYKQHKITEEDWRNREKWTLYKQAINDMVARTSTRFAPWTLVASNDKHFARIQVLKTVCDALEAVLEKKD